MSLHTVHFVLNTFLKHTIFSEFQWHTYTFNNKITKISWDKTFYVNRLYYSFVSYVFITLTLYLKRFQP